MASHQINKRIALRGNAWRHISVSLRGISACGMAAWRRRRLGNVVLAMA
jgi:hypothetical protein